MNEIHSKTQKVAIATDNEVENNEKVMEHLAW